MFRAGQDLTIHVSPVGAGQHHALQIPRIRGAKVYQNMLAADPLSIDHLSMRGFALRLWPCRLQGFSEPLVPTDTGRARGRAEAHLIETTIKIPPTAHVDDGRRPCSAWCWRGVCRVW